MGYRLGLDIGTTSCAAAVAVDGSLRMIELGHLSTAEPTLIVAQDEQLIVGFAAEALAPGAPTNVAREFKRRFGDPTPFNLGNVAHDASELTGLVFDHLIDSVSEQLGDTPASLAVTHPANWGSFRIDLLRSIIDQRAGVPYELVSEPMAAAVHYATQERVEAGTSIAVFDLGGGTFDTLIMEKTASTWMPIGSPGGIDRLGGVDFDAIVFDFVLEQLDVDRHTLDHADESTVAASVRLMTDCRAAKEALSSSSSASVMSLLPDANGSVRVTRSEFERRIEGDVHRAIDAMVEVIEETGMAIGAIDSILLVGGSSRIPLIAQQVTWRTGRPVAVDVHPKHAVALGAALLAPAESPAVRPEHHEPAPERPAESSPGLERPDDRVDRAEALIDRPVTEQQTPPAEQPPSPPTAAVTTSEVGRSRVSIFLSAAGILVLLLAGLAGTMLWPRWSADQTAADDADEQVASTSATSSATDPGAPATFEETPTTRPPTSSLVTTTLPPAPVVEPRFDQLVGPFGSGGANSIMVGNGPRTTPEAVWETTAGSYLRSAVAHEGALYGWSLDRTIIALDLGSGEVIWESAPVSGDTYRQSLRVHDDMVIGWGLVGSSVGQASGELVVIDRATGSERVPPPALRLLVEGGTLSDLVYHDRWYGLVLDHDEILDGGSGIIAVDDAGSLRWARAAASNIPGSHIIIGHDVLLLSDSGTVTAFDLDDGNVRWTTPLRVSVGSLRATNGVSTSRSLLFNHMSDGIHVVDLVSGDEGVPIFSKARRPVGSDEMLYVVTAADEVAAVDPRTAEVLWSQPIQLLGQTPSIIADEQTLFVVASVELVSGEGRPAVAMDRQTGEVLWRTTFPGRGARATYGDPASIVLTGDVLVLAGQPLAAYR